MNDLEFNIARLQGYVEAVGYPNKEQWEIIQNYIKQLSKGLIEIEENKTGKYYPPNSTDDKFIIQPFNNPPPPNKEDYYKFRD